MKTFARVIVCLLALFLTSVPLVVGQTTAPSTSQPVIAAAPTPVPLYRTIVGGGATYGSQLGTLPITGQLFVANLLSSPTSSNPVYSYTIIDFQPMLIEQPDQTTKLQFITVTTTGLAPFSRTIGPGTLWLIGTLGGAAGGDVAGFAVSGRAVYAFPILKSKGILGLANIGYIKTNAGGATATIFGLGVGWGKD